MKCTATEARSTIGRYKLTLQRLVELSGWLCELRGVKSQIVAVTRLKLGTF